MTVTDNPIETPNSTFSARETAGQGLCVSALLAARLRLPPAIIADAVDQGFFTARTWKEYDRLVAEDDRLAVEDDALPFVIEGPEAPNDTPPIESRSSRTERRYRGERKSEINALFARDGRASVESALRRVAARKTPDWQHWIKVCDECAEPFEATRSDARYCSPRCTKRASRAGRQPPAPRNESS